MNFSEFTKSIESLEKPVVLLEGSRDVLEKDSESLTKLAVKFARKFPKTLFRSGGAKGSDILFSDGVSRVDDKRMLTVLTTANKSTKDKTNAIFFDRLPESEQTEIFDLTIEATPHYKSPIDFYKKKQFSKIYYKTQFLLRDALKVYGSKDFAMPKADFGCFYVNSDKPTGGGTGHTIRICKLLNVPVIEQDDWLRWI